MILVGPAAAPSTAFSALIIGAHGDELDVGRVEIASLRGADDFGPAGVDARFGHGRVNAQQSVD